MSQFKLVTYQSPNGPRAGLVVGDAIFDIAAATGRATGGIRRRRRAATTGR